MRRRATDIETVEALNDELQRLRARSEELQSELYDLEVSNRVLKGEDEGYCRLVRSLREAVREHVPSDATLAVVSKGDPRLIDLYGREAWHFPRTPDGRYAGYYPKRGLSAVAHLEVLRARGADYFVLPAPSRWWLDHYPELRVHLQRRYLHITDLAETCLMYCLREPADPAQDPAGELERLLEENLPVFGEDPSILDWNTGLRLADALPDKTVFSPLRDDTALHYLDATVDLVAISTTDDSVADEAMRIASLAVFNFAGRPRGRKSGTRRLCWKDGVVRAQEAIVSIVIPCHNELQHTTACLTSLSETLPAWFRGEILVIDDGSSDGTADYVKNLSRRDRRIRVVRNNKNRGFLQSCNVGARSSRGDYILFLNNDTIMLPGWLWPLLRTFVDFPDAGVVGGKLLFEDGRLQEAGGLVFSDGSAAKIGYFESDIGAPIYQFVSEVDYVSAAFLMTPRSLWREVGGLDPRYGFGYYDDDDYCFAVRKLGRRVYFQPESVIVHVEGASAGTDLTAGLKQQQVLNQALFAEKWSDALKRQPPRPEPLDWYALRDLQGEVGRATGALR